MQELSPALSEKELAILSLIAGGFTSPQIAEKLSLSRETIKWYRRRLLLKFAASNSAEMVHKAAEMKLI